MKILVDADALPTAAKEVLFRVAERCKIPLTLVANKPLKVPNSQYLSSTVVGAGFNVADDWIADQTSQGDLIITADIPLARRVVENGGIALDPRGEVYDDSNVRERLATRNLMEELRTSNQILGGGPPPFGKKDVQKFANSVNQVITRLQKQ